MGISSSAGNQIDRGPRLTAISNDEFPIIDVVELDKYPYKLLKRIDFNLLQTKHDVFHPKPEVEESRLVIYNLMQLFKCFDDSERYKNLNRILEESDFEKMSSYLYNDSKVELSVFLRLQQQREKDCVYFKRCDKFYVAEQIDKCLKLIEKKDN